MVVKEVHDPDRVLEADDDMQSRGVEGQAHGRLLELLAEFLLEVVFAVLVRPDAHGSVCAASREQLLLDTDVKTVDLLRVERRNQVMIVLLRVGSFKVYVYLNDLVRVGCEHNRVFARRKSNSQDLVIHHVLVKHFVVFFVVRRWKEILAFYSFVGHPHVGV